MKKASKKETTQSNFPLSRSKPKAMLSESTEDSFLNKGFSRAKEERVCVLVIKQRQRRTHENVYTSIWKEKLSVREININSR